jgi:hypothetical protein
MLNTPFLAIVAVTPLFRPWRPIPCNMLENNESKTLFSGGLSNQRLSLQGEGRGEHKFKKKFFIFILIPEWTQSAS